MKILRIRLHPFGGIADHACDLHDGVNVIEGPNEFGKSTLNNALWHGLFTPTNLPPVSLKKAMGRWYPRPGGDHARVTLEFESDGHKWTLQKTWGAGASAIIQSTETAAIADPARVQEQLLALLHRNEATWRHVLFVGQAQLARTIQELREQSDEIDDIQPLIAGAAAIPGDISQDKLIAAVDSRIDAHFSRWDRTVGGPERGRGIDNPWANKVGPQLAAFYAMESTRRELGEVLAYEKQVDEINSQIREWETSIEADREFVATGRGLRDGLAKRGGLEERIKRLQGERDTLKKVLVDWPGADQVIRNKQEEVERITAGIKALDAELANAKKREAAEQLRKSHGQLVEARKKWELAGQNLKESKRVPTQLLEDLKRLATAIAGLRIQIAAQKLSARLVSKAPMSITVTRGAEAAQLIELVPGTPWEDQAEGKLSLELEDLRIDVASGTGDVQSLFEQLGSKTAKQKEILDELGLEDLAAVEAADKSHQQCVGDENTAKQLYEGALQGRTDEEWASEIATLDALQATRSVVALEEERTKEVNKKAKLEVETQQVQENVEKWKEEHTDLDALTTKILDNATELAGAEKELAGLPQLPDGFDSVAAYLDELGRKEQSQSDAEKALNALRNEHARLTGVTPKRTAEELREELEARERAFQRQEVTGQALLRIRAKLEEIVSNQGDEDPMCGLAGAVTRYFRDLTCGRYDGVRLEGATPVEVSGPIRLETGLLSQGTAGSLALATRLALAELYLDGMEGFLVLDDAFTDMDPDRRRAAERCLGAFAEQRQVIFFTCQPDHARELEEHAGAKLATIAGTTQTSNNNRSQ